MRSVRAWAANKKCQTIYGDVKKVLKFVATSESEWLLGKISDVPIPADIIKLRWIADIMSSENNIWGWYYYGQALFRLDDWNNGLSYIRRSANIGFLPAISFLAQCGNYEERELYIQKAADLNDPSGCYLWAVSHPSLEIMRNAADGGSCSAMNILLNNYSHELPSVYVAKIFAQHYLLSFMPHSFNFNRNSNEEYVVGRELEGHDVFLFNECIYFYLDVMHRARRAALQMTVGLVPYVGKDVARLIGKMVYESRNDVELWNSASLASRTSPQ